MTIQEMHYDVKMKLNKADSQQYRNLIIPQIDWILNEAQELFVKMIAEPRIASQYGYEIGQRTWMDIRSIVEEEKEVTPVNNLVTLPDNFWFYVSAYCEMEKGSCKKNSHKIFIRQHDDDFENSPFDKSSFEWKTVNGVFNSQGLKLYAEDFNITKVLLTYIRKLKYIHNAEGFNTNGYKMPSAKKPSTENKEVTYMGSENCELPESTHREIVDIAVLIATGQLQIPDYQIKKDKLSFNQIY